MSSAIFFVVICGGLWMFFGWRKATKEMIIKIGIKFKLYPKHYSGLPRWTQKIFGVDKPKIPRYLLYMCYATIIYFILVPIELILYCTGVNRIFLWLLLFHYWYMFANAIVFLSFSRAFNKRWPIFHKQNCVLNIYDLNFNIP